MGNKERFTTNSLLRKIRHSCTFLKRELYSKNKMCDEQQHLIDLCCRRLNHSPISCESGIDNFQLHCPEEIAGEQQDIDENSDYQANTVNCVDNTGTANTSEIAIEGQTHCLQEACLDLNCAPSATRSVERILEAASATVATTTGAPAVGSSAHAEQVSDTPRIAGKNHSTVPIAILQPHAGWSLLLNFLRYLETSRYNRFIL